MDFGDGFYCRSGLFQIQTGGEVDRLITVRFNVFEDEDGRGWYGFRFRVAWTVMGVITLGDGKEEVVFGIVGADIVFKRANVGNHLKIEFLIDEVKLGVFIYLSVKFNFSQIELSFGDEKSTERVLR